MASRLLAMKLRNGSRKIFKTRVRENRKQSTKIQFFTMNNWMTVKVKYIKQLDNGALKRVTEPYLLAAMTFTEAEARIYKELGSVIRGEFNVVAISRTEVHDIFAYNDSGVWYKCKVTYESMDADTERSKKVAQNFLVEANSVQEATNRLQAELKGLMVDFQIPSVSVSPIVDIFPYNSPEILDTKTITATTSMPVSENANSNS